MANTVKTVRGLQSLGVLFDKTLEAPEEPKKGYNYKRDSEGPKVKLRVKLSGVTGSTKIGESTHNPDLRVKHNSKEKETVRLGNFMRSKKHREK